MYKTALIVERGIYTRGNQVWLVVTAQVCQGDAKSRPRTYLAPPRAHIVDIAQYFMHSLQCDQFSYQGMWWWPEIQHLKDLPAKEILT